MQGLVYHGPGQKAWEEVPDPETAALGHDILEKVRHVRGVVAVRDQLVYPPAERSVAGLYI